MMHHNDTMNVFFFAKCFCCNIIWTLKIGICYTMQSYLLFYCIKKKLPGTVNDPCSRNKFLHACCVLTRPFNIYSHRSSFTLSGTNTTNTPCLSSHSPLPPLQQNTILFFFSSRRLLECLYAMAVTSGERALCLFICGCFFACQDKEGNTEPVWEHNFTLSALAWSAERRRTHTHPAYKCMLYTQAHTNTYTLPGSKSGCWPAE